MKVLKTWLVYLPYIVPVLRTEGFAPYPITTDSLSIPLKRRRNSNLSIIHSRHLCFPFLLNSSLIVRRERSNENDHIWKASHSDKIIRNLLVVGDGDLSFSASISRTLHESNIELIATVLEDQMSHEKIYKHSVMNQKKIKSFEMHQVLFGVDATDLTNRFPERRFDRIQFNFPHWRGKANHRYNRQLVDSFLRSASEILSEDGEVHITLVQSQGGFNARTLADYRDSWTPSFYAATHNLLLANVKTFEVTYNLSSHRGVDRGFAIGSEPQTFVFVKTKSMKEFKIPRENQLCCRHELHIVMPDDVQDHDEFLEIKWADIMTGDAVQRIIQKVVPEGIRVEVPSRNILDKKDTKYKSNMAVFLVLYCGESKAITRVEADSYRKSAEMEIEKYVPLRDNRKGRMVSRPFPHYLLGSILEENDSLAL